ncbi:hypothetical protein, partial [Deinococcus aquaticus]|uniref:hypothetical protein n=1 Tax=Deinococcus aquaticus TaxID=328692 RepID=UPI003F45DE1F
GSAMQAIRPVPDEPVTPQDLGGAPQRYAQLRSVLYPSQQNSEGSRDTLDPSESSGLAELRSRAST